MNYNTSQECYSINSTCDLIQAIQQHTFIVGSHSTTGMSFASNPKTHATEKEARAECKRLATLHAGKMFLFVKLAGAEQVPVALTISI